MFLQFILNIISYFKTLYFNIYNRDEVIFDKIDNHKWQKNVQNIFFDYTFNKSLDNVIFPDTVKVISFKQYLFRPAFNRDITNVTFPKYLIHLNLGDSYNYDITDIIFPDTLQELILGISFDKSIKNLHAKGLKHLTLPSCYDQCIKNANVPNSLLSLSFLSNRNQIITHRKKDDIYKYNYYKRKILNLVNANLPKNLLYI